MVMVFVHNCPDQDGERFTCSDHSQGEAVLRRVGHQKIINFAFSEHSHPSFWVTADRFKNGQQVTVDLVNQVEKFALRIS